MNCSMPGLPVHHQLLKSTKPMSIELVMPSNHLILCYPLLLLPSIFPSIRVFSNESALRIRWPNIAVSASTSVLPVNTQDLSPLRWTGWIALQSKGLSRRQGTLQHHSSNASILWRSAFFIVQLSHPHISSVQFSSFAQSCLTLCDPMNCSTRPPCPSPSPRVHSDSHPLSPWFHLPSYPWLSPCPPAPNPSQHQSLFQWVNSSHEVSKVLELQL